MENAKMKNWVELLEFRMAKSKQADSGGNTSTHSPERQI